MKFPPKQIVIVAIILIVIFVVLGMAYSSRSKSQKTGVDEVFPTEAVIPTVDESVIVDLDANAGKTDVTISVKSAPSGTESIDYELSYQTKEQGLQGAIGSLKKKTSTTFSAEATLGTCSSGSCVYHQVTRS